MRRFAPLLLLFAGCVQFPNTSAKMDIRTEDVRKPDPIRADQINDENAVTMAQLLWDELESDR